MDNIDVKIKSEVYYDLEQYSKLNDINLMDLINTILKKGFMEVKYGHILPKGDTKVEEKKSSSKDEEPKDSDSVEGENLNDILKNSKNNLYNE